MEALRLCLECNNSLFKNNFYLQKDGTVQDPRISCSYSNIVMTVYDEKANDRSFKPLIWKCFREDVIVLWIHNDEDVNHCLDHLNKIGASCQIRFTMQTENENDHEVLNLKLKLKGCKKITVKVYSKPTNSFTYANPKTCYPSRNISKIPEGIAVRLKCIL